MVSSANFSACEMSSDHASAVSTSGIDESVQTSSTCGSHLQHSKMAARFTCAKVFASSDSTICQGSFIYQWPCKMTSAMPSPMSSALGIAPNKNELGAGFRGVGLEIKSSNKVIPQRINTGQPLARKSETAACAECQSPATARPKIKPEPIKNPAVRQPEAMSR